MGETRETQQPGLVDQVRGVIDRLGGRLVDWLGDVLAPVPQPVPIPVQTDPRHAGRRRR